MASRLQSFFAKTLSLTAYDLCDIQAVEDFSTFVTVDGYYCSAFRLLGGKQYLGKDSHPEAVEAITTRLTNLWREPGRQVQVVFTQDPEAGAAYESEKQLSGLLESSKRLGLNIAPIVEERRALWKGKVFHESCVVVVKTSLATLTKNEAKKAIAEREPMKFASIAQDPSRGYVRLMAKHKAFVEATYAAIANICLVEEMSVQEIGREINTAITGQYDDAFRLKLSSDIKRTVPPRLQVNGKIPGDPSAAMQPPLAHQFFRERPVELPEEPGLIKLHGRFIAPIQVETWSDKPAAFNQLIDRVDRKYPFTISFTFQTGKNEVKSFLGKSFRMAKLAQIFNKDNAAQASAAKTLTEFLSSNSTNAVKGHMAACTWAKSKEEALARKEELSSALSSWCGVRAVEYLDDPVKLWTECVPALARRPVSIPSAVVLGEAFSYLPIDRPATSFKEGTMPLFSTDFKFLPFSMGAAFQRTWNNNFFAPPGSGKSVAMFGACLALTLNPENRQVPKQVFLDIGHAGVGLVKLYKALLGTEKAHRAQHYTLLNDGSVYINPFDTMTCNRLPTQTENEDIQTVLSLVYTPPGQKAVNHLDTLVPELIRKAYDMFSDQTEPKQDVKVYKKNVIPEIDARLAEGGFDLEDEPYWWEIADALLYKEEYELAQKATRQAVPQLRDINRIVAQDEDIKRKYGDLIVEGMPILDYVRLYTENTASDIQVLGGPTNFEATDTDMLVFNLQNVINTETASGQKTSGIMYLLAMIAGSREFFQTEDIVDSVSFSKDEAVKNYHRGRIRRNFATKRHLILDEYHVTEHVPYLDMRILRYRRIGRKNNTIISIATQFDTDVSTEQRGIATNTFFMAADDKAKMLARQERYKFNNDILNQAMEEQVGPGVMLHFAETKKGSTWQVCRDLKGPLELWAFSSTGEDIDIRTAIESRTSFWEACTLLGREFPRGSLGDFQSKYVRYLQKTFANSSDLRRIVDSWYEHLAKAILNDPTNWRTAIQGDD